MTQPAFESVAMYRMLHRLQADQDIGDLLDGIDIIEPSSDGLKAASAPAPQLELALAWIDTSIPVSFYVYINDISEPFSCAPLRGGKAFVRIPSHLLRPGTNKLIYRIHFWASGWKYQLWSNNGSERKKVAEGKDASPGGTKGEMEYGEKEIEL